MTDPDRSPSNEPPTPASERLAVGLVLVALFFSGVAAIINQTVWQRALQLYLSGSEALSAMIVVLVFMLGLGAGALHIGRRAHRLGNPMRALGAVELALVAINLLIALVLSLDVAETVYAAQRVAASVGVPRGLLYAVASTALLLVPCYLMGVTMPLVSEVAQRQLAVSESRFLTVLFVLNTLGAVGGALASGFFLMPWLGQRTALVCGAGGNLLAGAIVLATQRWRWTGDAPPAARPAAAPASGRRLLSLDAADWTSFGLGLLALGYEMYLFRIVTLALQPLPYVFSAVLCTYLFLWSVGVFLARRVRADLPPLLLATGAAVALAPLLYSLGGWTRAPGVALLDLAGDQAVTIIVFALPCVGFGVLFGRLVARVAAGRWGDDVGRFYGMNTLGSCLGILLATLVGYELPHGVVALGLAAGYLALLAVYVRGGAADPVEAPARRRRAVAVAAVAGLLAAGAVAQAIEAWRSGEGYRVYASRDGVIEVVERDGHVDVLLDGLWHSDLPREGEHVGGVNWKLAVVPLLCHPDAARDKDVLVVGNGTGITAAVLARSDRVARVDAYEINPGLARVIADYPERTLGVASEPKVRILYEDGRLGLALREQSYDVITSAPLYLQQAGATVLLSREYIGLAKRRLREGGVFAVFARSFDERGPAQLVRATMAAMFEHTESFAGGFLLVGSDREIRWDAAALGERLGAMAEASRARVGVDAFGGRDALVELIDRPRLEWGGPMVISDDRPIVEYPRVATQVVEAWEREREWERGDHGGD